jgi:pimeloyl-ACP methyl ester carboxylesterase
LHRVRSGIEIGARTSGCGRAVLLLHGVGTASASFWAQFGDLDDGRQLIAWDAPGYGSSGEPRGPVRLDDYADAAVALLEAHGQSDAHVVGVSWGGVIATRMALRHPDRVRTLALIGSTFGRKRNAALLERFTERIGLLEREGPRAFTATRVDALVSPAAPAELKARIVETAAAAVRLPGYRAATQILADTDHRHQLKSVRAPTLVLCGDHDVITGIPESRVLADGIPGAVLRIVRGGGHLLNQERPDAVNAALRTHWEEFDGYDGGKS